MLNNGENLLKINSKNPLFYLKFLQHFKIAYLEIISKHALIRNLFNAINKMHINEKAI